MTAGAVFVSQFPNPHGHRMRTASSDEQGRSSISLAFNQAKRRVDVWIIRTKPISKRPAKQAMRSAAGSSLHYVMMTIEEVFGVPGVVRFGTKAGKRLEHSRCPFPTVTHQLCDTVITVALGRGGHGDRVPGREVERSISRGKRLVAPGIFALDTVARGIRSSMELRLGRELLILP